MHASSSFKSVHVSLWVLAIVFLKFCWFGRRFSKYWFQCQQLSWFLSCAYKMNFFMITLLFADLRVRWTQISSVFLPGNNEQICRFGRRVAKYWFQYKKISGYLSCANKLFLHVLLEFFYFIFIFITLLLWILRGRWTQISFVF